MIQAHLPDLEMGPVAQALEIGTIQVVLGNVLDGLSDICLLPPGDIPWPPAVHGRSPERLSSAFPA